MMKKISQKDPSFFKFYDKKYITFIKQYPELYPILEAGYGYIDAITLIDSDVVFKYNVHILLNDIFFIQKDSEFINKNQYKEISNIFHLYGYVGIICWMSNFRAIVPLPHITNSMVFKKIWNMIYCDSTKKIWDWNRENSINTTNLYDEKDSRYIYTKEFAGLMFCDYPPYKDNKIEYFDFSMCV